MEPSGYDWAGRPHWCEYKGGYLWCFGVMYACGHRYACFRDPGVLGHDRLHRAENIAWGLFSVSLLIALFGILLIRLGIIP